MTTGRSVLATGSSEPNEPLSNTMPRPPTLGAYPSDLRPFRPISRRAAWQRWLLRSFQGRALLVGISIKVFAAVVGFISPAAWETLDVVDAIGSLTLIFIGLYGVGRLTVWTKRRLLWRVRRKLILSYIFVGLVPGLLIIAFFLLAGMLLFFNVSSYLVQSRVRTLVDQTRFLAQSIVLEAEHDEPASVLERRLRERQVITAERFPFTSMVIVPVKGVDCPNLPPTKTNAPPTLTIGPWGHLDPPRELPRWIRCDGFEGLIAYGAPVGTGTEHKLVMRAVVLPQTRTPTWAVLVDMPFTVAIEDRLQRETGIKLGEVTSNELATLGLPAGRLLEERPRLVGEGPSLGRGWVAILECVHWATGATSTAAVAIELNLAEVYDRISSISGGRDVGTLLLALLAFIGVLFLIIQLVALVIGFVLARQITGAVHDLFTGTEHLRNRDFSHQIPVRASDQLGELADSFNVMTREVTKLLRENAEKARMEQEMLAAREIQQKLLPAGPLNVPGFAVNAFCEPAREVAGDYFDFLHVSDTKLGLLIADVSGKGLPAGLYMAQLKVLAQSLGRSHPSPKDFLIALNRVMADNIDAKSFITMSYGVIDLEKREMVFARAGHCPLIRVPGAAPPGMRKSEILTPDGLVVGLKIDDDGEKFRSLLEEVTIPLSSDDLIVFFTDGISETMNQAFECYGEPRLAKVLEQYSHLPFEQLRSFIVADLRAFADGADQHDDMTMILLKVEPVAVLSPEASQHKTAANEAAPR